MRPTTPALYKIKTDFIMYNSEYLLQFYIKSGDFLVTKQSLKANVRYLAKVFGIKYKNISYSIDKDFIDTVTFVNCYNEEQDLVYYNLPNIKYKELRYNKHTIQGETVDRVVDNACILARINKFDIENIGFMKYLFLVTAMHYMNENSKSNITVNELLASCCVNLIEKLDNERADECILNQCIRNCSRKTVTLGSISSKEKNRISHTKFTDEEKGFVIISRTDCNMSIRKTKEEFEKRYNKTISIRTIQQMLKED